jgi:hypothetical protein
VLAQAPRAAISHEKIAINPSAGWQVMFAEKFVRLLMLAAIASLASCATPEQIREFRQKYPPLHDFILNQTNELAAKVTERDLDACRAVFAKKNGTFVYMWRTYEITGPFAASPGFLCWKQAQHVAPGRWSIRDNVAMVAPARQTAGVQIRDFQHPFWCVLTYENGAFSVEDAGVGYPVSRPSSECEYPNDPLKLRE